MKFRMRSNTVAALVGLILVRIVLAGWFATMTPLWEHFDEVNHYYVAQYRGGIDDVRPQLDWPAQYQIFNQFDQPPLYHSLVGILIRPFSQPVPELTGNPTPFCLYPQPANFYVHQMAKESPFAQPYRGIWLARSITILIGAISIVGVWFAARILWPQLPNRAWLAAILYTLFSPAIDLSAWFNNDAPLMLIGVLMLIVLALWLKSATSRRILISIIAIFIVGIAIKINTIALIPAILYVAFDKLIFQQRRGQSRRLLLLVGVIVFVFVLFVGVNFALCGSALCRTHRALTLENFSVLANPFINQYTLPSFNHLLRTISAPSINPAYPPPHWTIGIMTIILTIGCVSTILEEWETRSDRRIPAVLLLIIGGTLLLALLRVWWLGVAFMPARYFAVAFPALILLIAAGFHFLFLRLHWSMGLVPVLAFLLISIVAIRTSYVPLWQLPQRVAQIPADTTPVNIQFENGVTVAAYTIHNTSMALYLSTDRPLSEPLALEVAMIDGAGQSLSHCEMLAGSPSWSTSDWQPDNFVMQQVGLVGLADILDTVYIRIRLINLDNQIFVNTIPDYENEVRYVSDSNLISITPPANNE